MNLPQPVSTAILGNLGQFSLMARLLLTSASGTSEPLHTCHGGHMSHGSPPPSLAISRFSVHLVCCSSKQKLKTMCIIFAWSGSQRSSAGYSSNDSRAVVLIAGIPSLLLQLRESSLASGSFVFYSGNSCGWWSLSLSLEPAAEGPVLLDLSLF